MPNFEQHPKAQPLMSRTTHFPTNVWVSFSWSVITEFLVKHEHKTQHGRDTNSVKCLLIHLAMRISISPDWRLWMKSRGCGRKSEDEYVTSFHCFCFVVCKVQVWDSKPLPCDVSWSWDSGQQSCKKKGEGCDFFSASLGKVSHCRTPEMQVLGAGFC